MNLLKVIAVAAALGCALPAAAQSSGSSQSAPPEKSASEQSASSGGQSSPLEQRADSGNRDWGWLGLLGLIGLAGLRRRRDEHHYDAGTTRRTTP